MCMCDRYHFDRAFIKGQQMKIISFYLYMTFQEYKIISSSKECRKRRLMEIKRDYIFQWRCEKDGRYGDYIPEESPLSFLQMWKEICHQ